MTRKRERNKKVKERDEKSSKRERGEREGKKERERESCNEKVIFRPASSPISFRHLVVAVVIVFDFVFSRFLCSKLPPRSSTLQNG